MRNVYLGKSVDGRISLGSDTNAALFKEDLKEHPNATYRIERLSKPVSENLRAYYFGALIPEVRATCDAWKDLSGEQIHEIIKKMLFYFEAFNPITNRVERFGRSVMSKDDFNNTDKAMGFIDVICDYLVQNGREIPNPEEYKAFRDSAPLKVD